MHRFIAFCLSLLVLTAFGQEEDEEFKTLFGNAGSSGGYGAPELRLTTINNETSLMMGGRGGWIIGHSFVIGGGGCGLVTNNIFEYTERIEGMDSTRNYNIDMGYGGLLLEYIAFPKSAVHIAVPVLIGAGGANLSYEIYNINDPQWNDWNKWEYVESSAFFFVEPGLEVEFNMTKFFRLNMGASYRFVEGTDLKRLSDDDLTGMSFNLTLKFGKF
ncbi:MAG: hypothetical protein K8R53_13030 [Bacteroidales bacterium]|nr:hypothetical protein [Bacteroidales bacterium]